MLCSCSESHNSPTSVSHRIRNLLWAPLKAQEGTSCTCRGIAVHGMLTCSVLEDGLGIHAIRLRLRHYFEVVLPFESAYTLWLVFHYLLKVGNSDRTDNDPETDDDLIYEFLDWKNEPIYLTTMTAILFFPLIPILQLVIWILSGCRPRYIKITDSDATGHAEMSITDVAL